MKLLGSTKTKITKNENGDYQQGSYTHLFLINHLINY